MDPKDELKRDLGEQPIAELLTRLGLKPADLVDASPDQITHKMVARACKGRRLTPKVQAKVLKACQIAANETFQHGDLFNYDSKS
tara:strand:+ start:334 stop:588 length:255 start_codon:yes stop_codon:yes gene_type:complete